MDIKHFYKKVDELTQSLDIDIESEKDSINFGLAFLLLPEAANIDLGYDTKEELIKTQYQFQKNYAILSMVKELQRLDRECNSKIKTLNKYKEIDKRVEEKIKALGLEMY